MNALANGYRAAILATLALAAVAGPAAGAQTQYPFSLTLYDQLDYRGGSVTFYGDNANIGSTGFASRARSAQVRGTWRLCEGGGFRNRCEVLSANVRDLDAYGLAGRVGSAQRLSGVAATPPTPQPQPRPIAPYNPYAADPYAGAPAPRAAEPAYGAPPPPYAPRAYGPDAYAPPAVDAPMPDAPGRLGRDGYPALPAAAPPAPAPRGAAPAYGAPYVSPAPYGPGAYDPNDYPPAPYPAYAAAADPDGPALGDSAVFFPQPTLRGADVSAASNRAADGFCRAQGLGPAIYFDQTRRLPRAVDVEGRPVGEGPILRDVLCRRF
jgi:hypothetical protein